MQLRTSPCFESEESDSQGGAVSSIEALVQLFLIREEAARNTDEMTSGLSTEGKYCYTKSCEEVRLVYMYNRCPSFKPAIRAHHFLHDAVTKVWRSSLHKAGTHSSHLLVASYLPELPATNSPANRA